MNVTKIENLYESRYRAEVINALKPKWVENESYDFFENKKQQHLFVLLLGCKAIYTLKDGRTLEAPKGSIVYTPEGSEYRVTFVDCDTKAEFNCVSVNFKLFDSNDMPFRFTESDVKIYTIDQSRRVLGTLHEIADMYQFAVLSPMKVNGLFYVMLSELSSYYRTQKTILRKYNMIADGITAIENNPLNRIQVQELAKMCNVSPVYFRQLFKAYSGTTPINYKLNALISQAKQHLLYSNKSVSEIAELLGFSSQTYFCRIFKKKTGMTPLEFIRNESEGREPQKISKRNL